MSAAAVMDEAQQPAERRDVPLPRVLPRVRAQPSAPARVTTGGSQPPGDSGGNSNNEGAGHVSELDDSMVESVEGVTADPNAIDGVQQPAGEQRAAVDATSSPAHERAQLRVAIPPRMSGTVLGPLLAPGGSPVAPGSAHSPPSSPVRGAGSLFEQIGQRQARSFRRVPPGASDSRWSFGRVPSLEDHELEPWAQWQQGEHESRFARLFGGAARGRDEFEIDPTGLIAQRDDMTLEDLDEIDRRERGMHRLKGGFDSAVAVPAAHNNDVSDYRRANRAPGSTLPAEQEGAATDDLERARAASPRRRSSLAAVADAGRAALSSLLPGGGGASREQDGDPHSPLKTHLKPGGGRFMRLDSAEREMDEAPPDGKRQRFHRAATLKDLGGHATGGGGRDRAPRRDITPLHYICATGGMPQLLARLRTAPYVQVSTVMDRTGTRLQSINRLYQPQEEPYTMAPSGQIPLHVAAATRRTFTEAGGAMRQIERVAQPGKDLVAVLLTGRDPATGDQLFEVERDARGRVLACLHQDCLGQTPLHAACLSDAPDAVAVAVTLLEANPLAAAVADHDGLLPLDVALEVRPRCVSQRPQNPSPRVARERAPKIARERAPKIAWRTQDSARVAAAARCRAAALTRARAAAAAAPPPLVLSGHAASLTPY